MADELEVTFDIGEDTDFDCEFSIDATTFDYTALDNKPQINNVTLEGNKTSEELHLASAEGLAGLFSALDFEIQARETADTNINSAITLEIANRINTDNNLQSQIDTKQPIGDYATNSRVDSVVDAFDNDIETISNEIEDLIQNKADKSEIPDVSIYATNQRVTDVADELNQTIEENVVALQQEDTALQNQINAHSTTLTAYDTRITNNTNAITQEIADRQAGDNTLQEQVNDNKNLIDTKQDIISDLSTIRSNAQAGYDIIPQVQSNTQRIEDLTVARFPNAIIVGTPRIEGGQVSGFSDSNYLQFPFVDISRGLPFDIYFSFTTSSDVNTQQNILDAHFGIALAIQNGKGIMALSSNGTSWDIGTSTGTNTLLPNTTYFVKYSWTGTAYSAALSTNETEYIPDMNLTSSLSPYKTTIFIGGSPNLFGAGSAHPFKGTINFNKSKVIVNGITVWEGMADVGLASRANVSLTNLDEVGENRFNEKQDILTAGTGIDITNNVISNTQTSAEWGNIQGELSNQTDLQTALDSKVGFTDYATGSTGGVIKTTSAYALNMSASGNLFAREITNSDYPNMNTLAFISKGTLENIKENLVTSVGDTKYQATISDLETIRAGASKGATALQTIPIAKANVVGGVAGGNWLTVNQTTGKMECGELTKAQYDSALGYTFISKTTLNNVLVTKQDVIPDLDTYVKNTDYAGADKAGLIKASNTFNTTVTGSGYLSGVARTLTQHNNDANGAIICKGTLENIKESLVTSVGDGKYQNKLTAGDNITIENDVISVAGIAEQLTTKVDIDSSWGFPSSRSINLTIGATETQYTAPANGWFTISGRPTGNGGYVILDDNPVTWMHSGTAGWYARGFIPVKKGHTIVLRYGNYEIEPYFFKFIYAEGAE